MSIKIGIAGPVGSGKTSIIEQLTNKLKNKYKIAIITNDIYTKEDANYLKNNLDINPSKIVGVETGGCPHTAIRDDISANQRAIEEVEENHKVDLIFIESGGDNLSATFSYELVDYYIYVIDVAQGEDIPRKKGAGLLFCDLLVVNKTDLAPYVDIDLDSMEKDVKISRKNKPYVFLSKKNEGDIELIVEWIEVL